MEFKRFSYRNIEEIRNDADSMNIDLSYTDDLSVLSEKVKIKNFELSNRLAVHPMEALDAEITDGAPTELTFRRYKRYAEGGAGLIWFEAISTVGEGRNFPAQLWINKDNLDGYKRLAAETIETHQKKFGGTPLLVAQITHSGRFSKPFGAYASMNGMRDPYMEEKHPYSKDFELVSDEYLERLEDKYVEAAILAKEAGFQAVDLKCCHKYLVSELVGAFTREGKYGGSFENRTRFLVNVLDKIKSVLGDSVIYATRMNIYDRIPYPYGWGTDKEDYTKPDFSEVIELLRIMQGKGLSIINCTMSSPYYEPHISRPYDSGGYIPGENQLVGVERLINSIAEIQRAMPDLGVVGTGYSWLRQFAPYFAAAAIKEGKSTLVGLGRMSFAYPDFARDIIENGKLESNKVCVCCGNCVKLLRSGNKAGCVIRDKEIYLPVFKELK